MTAIEDARATADTLRDVDCEDRNDMIQAIERAERDIRALIAEHERLTVVLNHRTAHLDRLTTAPIDDEREALARRFHETYERLAPSYGYETRAASAVPWEDVPDSNKRLMIAVAGEILAGFHRQELIADARTGAELIAAERERQIREEGYTAEHDRDHTGDLIAAAVGYAQAGGCDITTSTYPSWVANDPDDPAVDWPWHPSYWKPTGDPIRDLTKAGALLAAAIDSVEAARNAS